MRGFKSWKWLLRKRHVLFDGVTRNFKMKPFMGFICTVMLFVVYKTTNYQYLQTELDSKLHPLYTSQEVDEAWRSLIRLPRGIIQSTSDLDLRPLWTTNKPKANDFSHRYLLAIPVGISQKDNVDNIVQKFLPVNFTIVLFHYDGKVDGWQNLEWSNQAIHIVGQNQTKWWFAKRFLHPAVVSVYDYIFLWDEDLGVEDFDPRRYLDIVKSQGFQISQPALDPNSTGIHHRITIRSRRKQFHRRVYDKRGKTKCSGDSEGPPCSGFVEGMAPVFSRSAWHCTWHLIQNDLVHGWGLDMKLGYCAQGDRTKNIGVVDSEYLVHQSIQTLGGPSAEKGLKTEELLKRHIVDVRAEIRRQSTVELKKFKARWEKAIEEDKNWVDPFKKRRERLPKKNQETLQSA
ncbi:Phosphate import ATP-binding protein like [Heracleum sosnowskyi]|uniref:Phosphate import ATP-binding protein like n=1 Tax=Heracleum sosnowskyi TaxID=360622 RepID=A0AAD8HKX1_9APIA|nr:Phosphate import ATP-binding protein like [Heracleum sosnowskyi]